MFGIVDEIALRKERDKVGADRPVGEHDEVLR